MQLSDGSLAWPGYFGVLPMFLQTIIKSFSGLQPSKLRSKARAASLIRKATVRNESFHCKALAGESDYNITINSDMTVSCNCQDFDGLGRIGDLTRNSLKEVFSGPVACKFREMLAARKFPTPICINCSELELKPVEEANSLVSHYRVPYKGIQVGNTARCNLRCHMCNREKLLALRGEKHSLSLGDVEKIALILKEYGIGCLRFYNLGEPFLPSEVHEQISIIRKFNPDIRITTLTNGQLLRGTNKIKAALSMDYIGISLDGVNQDTVSKYQVGASFENAYNNMVTLVSERRAQTGRVPIIEWIYILFRWNDHPEHIAKAIELAKNANVDMIGFYRGDVRYSDRSFRWYYHPYFKQLGKTSNDRVLVNLNNIPPHQLCP